MKRVPAGARVGQGASPVRARTSGRGLAKATPRNRPVRKATIRKTIRKATPRKPSAHKAIVRKATVRRISDTEKARAAEIVERLARAYPDWGPTLEFSTPFDLLIATILAAQATDERTNQVTRELFRKYRTPQDYLGVPEAALQRQLVPTGFFRQKTKAVRACSQDLIDKFNGVVPRDIDSLTQLHGVGRKTASIVLGAAFGVPSIAVDRHVARVSQRLRLSRQSDPDKIEMDLRPRIAEADWIKATWTLVLHGRRTCTSLRPACPRCPVNELCPWPYKTKA
jgi:endonuclease-3